jgi:hypothetical protein
MVANYSRILAEGVKEVKTKDPCTLDYAAFDAEAQKRVPRWNRVARDAMSIVGSLGKLWVVAGRRDVDAELTAVVLRIEAERKGGPWPATMAPIQSTVCSGMTWTCSVAGDTMTLVPSIKVQGTEKDGLPVEVQVTAGTTAPAVKVAGK